VGFEITDSVSLFKGARRGEVERRTLLRKNWDKVTSKEGNDVEIECNRPNPYIKKKNPVDFSSL
jgi:hypothetical protein